MAHRQADHGRLTLCEVWRTPCPPSFGLAMLKRRRRGSLGGGDVSLSSDAGVCRDCGKVGTREWMHPIDAASGYDAYRCPECATGQPAEASS
jgi:hypothetical protein